MKPGAWGVLGLMTKQGWLKCVLFPFAVCSSTQSTLWRLTDVPL